MMNRSHLPVRDKLLITNVSYGSPLLLTIALLIKFLALRLFNRWLQLSHVSTHQQLSDLCIKNKVLKSCNMNPIIFLQERDPQSLEELTRLGDQYYAAHPNSKVQKETTFNAFACEGNSEVSDDKVDAFAVQKFSNLNINIGLGRNGQTHSLDPQVNNDLNKMTTLNVSETCRLYGS